MSKAKKQSAIVPIGDNQAVVNFGDRFAAQRAAQMVSNPVTGSGMPLIKGVDGKFKFGPTSDPVATFRAVPLVMLRANAWNDKPYVEGSDDPPVCGAFAGLNTPEALMKPTEGWPNPQSELCNVCPNGVRNAPLKCRKRLYVAVIHAESVTSPLAIEKATVAMLDLSETAWYEFNSSVGYMEEKAPGSPLFFGVYDWIRTQPTGKYWRTEGKPYGFACEPDSPVLDALAKRVEAAVKSMEGMARPKSGSVAESEAEEEQEEKKAAPRRKSSARKKTTKKKSRLRR